MSELLFSYGTLQFSKVQQELFGRKLIGSKETLSGYCLDELRITDESVLLKSEQDIHPIAVRTGVQSDKVHGTLFEVSQEELYLADSYEVAAYTRVRAMFDSGKEGWVFVKS